MGMLAPAIGERPRPDWRGDVTDPLCPTYVELGAGLVVTRTPVGASECVWYDAWEPFDRGVHHLYLVIGKRRYGRVSDRPAETPNDAERIAHSLILRAFEGDKLNDAGHGMMVAPLG